jgi:hypothetical protein
MAMDELIVSYNSQLYLDCTDFSLDNEFVQLMMQK